jgi:hypothetical protein
MLLSPVPRQNRIHRTLSQESVARVWNAAASPIVACHCRRELASSSDASPAQAHPLGLSLPCALSTGAGAGQSRPAASDGSTGQTGSPKAEKQSGSRRPGVSIGSSDARIPSWPGALCSRGRRYHCSFDPPRHAPPASNCRGTVAARAGRALSTILAA